MLARTCVRRYMKRLKPAGVTAFSVTGGSCSRNKIRRCGRRFVPGSAEQIGAPICSSERIYWIDSFADTFESRRSYPTLAERFCLYNRVYFYYLCRINMVKINFSFILILLYLLLEWKPILFFFKYYLMIRFITSYGSAVRKINE